MSVFLKGCNFEHTELSIHFLSFNDECAILTEAKDANRLSQESKLTRCTRTLYQNLHANVEVSKKVLTTSFSSVQYS